MEWNTGNDWTQRVGELRQIVSDQYDPATGTPQEWLDWWRDNALADDEDLTPDEQRVMLRYATEIAERHAA